MALIKSIEQPTKFVTEYVNIQRLISLVFTDDHKAHCEARLGMYRDEAARKEGATPVMRDTSFSISPEKAGLLKKVLYEALKEPSDPSDPMNNRNLIFSEATDHTESTDPDLSGLVDFLKDWELKILQARVQAEMAERSLSPLTEEEIAAYFSA